MYDVHCDARLESGGCTPDETKFVIPLLLFLFPVDVPVASLKFNHLGLCSSF